MLCVPRMANITKVFSLSDNIINWSHVETRTRFNVSVGVAYGSDTALVEKVLLDCARSHPDIATNPEPVVPL